MLEQLLERVELGDQDTACVAQEPEVPRRDFVPGEHREAPQLGDRQVVVVAWMKGDPDHAVSAVAGVMMQRFADALKYPRDPRCRTRPHSDPA